MSSVGTRVLTTAAACAQSLSRVRLSATPWTVARQVPLSMGFCRQEYWVPLSMGFCRQEHGRGCHSLLQLTPGGAGVNR